MKRRKSKLEMYISILETLLVNGPMNETRITLKVNISSSPLKKILADLEENNLVEERTLREKRGYAATPKVRTILSHLRRLNRILPIIEMSGYCVIDQYETRARSMYDSARLPVPHL